MKESISKKLLITNLCFNYRLCLDTSSDGDYDDSKFINCVSEVSSIKNERAIIFSSQSVSKNNDSPMKFSHVYESFSSITYSNLLNILSIFNIDIFDEKVKFYCENLNNEVKDIVKDDVSRKIAFVY